MALEFTAGTPVGVSVTVEDRDKNRSTVTVSIMPLETWTIADIEAFSGSLEAAVALLTDGFIVGGNISIPLNQALPYAQPPEKSDVERKGVLTMRTSNGLSVGKVEIPSLDNANVIDGTSEINRTSAGYLALSSLLLSPPVVNGVGFAMDEVVRAYKAHRGSRRG